MRKRIVALAVAVALLLGMLPFSVSADNIAEGICGDDLTWIIDEGCTLIIRGSGDMYDYSEENPPWSEYSDSIRRVWAEGGDTISAGAFQGCPNLHELSVYGPHTIGMRAFSGCENLHMVDLFTVGVIEEEAFAGCQFVNVVENTDQLVSIGDRAFEDCWDLSEFSFSDSLTHIGDEAFRNCRLSELNLGSSVESIGAGAFAGCRKMGELVIPASVRFIGAEAFSEMHEITAFVVDPENPYFSSGSDGCLYSKDQTVLLQTPGQISGVFEVPQSVTTIAGKAFYNSWLLTGVVLGDHTVVLGDGAFAGCEKLTEIKIGNSLETIGSRAFQDCRNVSRIIFPTSIGFIGTDAFQCSGIDRLVFTGDAPVFAEAALAGISATIYYPAGNSTWTSEVMCDYDDAITWVPVQSCSEEGHHYEVTVFDPTCVLDGYTEYFCTSCGDRYEDAYVPALGHDFDGRNCTRCPVMIASQGSCGSDAYYRLTTEGALTIYGSGSVSDSPWSGSSVKSLVVEDGITGIFRSAFEDHYNLERVSLPGSLVEIPQNGFASCSNLTEVTIEEGVQSINSYSFYECISLRNIHLPDSVTSIGADAFGGCSGLEYINLGEGLISIGERAFRACTALKEIQFPDTLTTIGGAAFEASGLKYVYLGDGIESLGFNAFADCTALESVEVSPDNKFFSSDQTGCLFDKEKTTLLYVPYAVSGALVIPDSVTAIEESACRARHGINSAYIGNGVKSIGEYAFRDCTGLVYVEFGSNVDMIGSAAFFACTKLKCARFIGNAPTSGVGGLTNDQHLVIYYPGDNETWANMESTQKMTLIPENSCPEHHFDADATAPTCTEMGFTTYLCRNCGYSYEDDYVNALTHSYEDDVCSTCGYVKEIIGSGSGGDHITWEMTSDGTITFSGRGTLSSVPVSQKKEIKNVVIEYGITKIRGNCFSYCSNMTSIVFPDSVTELGQHTFAGCSSLVSMILPPKLKELGGELFSGCTNLKSIVIPEEVKTIEGGAFFRCYELSNVVLSDGLTRIESAVFRECASLKELNLPNSINYIGSNAFEACVSLKELNLPNSINYIGANAFNACVNLERVEFAGRMPEMDETAFTNCNCTIAYHGSDCSWLDIAGTELGAFSLEWVNLDETIGAHITDICPKLEPTCTESGYDEYEFCIDCGRLLSAYTVLTPLGHDYEETRTEPKCRAEGSIHGDCIRCDETFDTVIPETGHTYDTEDPNACCIICGVPANCVVDGSCGVDAFWYLLEEGTLIIDGSGPMLNEDDMRKISREDVESVVIGDGITQICSDAFSGCKNLKNVTIGANVENIGGFAFDRCSSLERIEIPASVRGIHRWAFEGCTSMQAFIVSEDNLFYSNDAGGVLYNKDQTTLHLMPKKYSGEYHLLDGVEIIAKSAFDDCVELTAVYIPSSITTIPVVDPFKGCSNLTGIYVEEGSTEYSSIDGCLVWFGGLEYVPKGKTGDFVIPETINSIGSSAFKDCSKLTSITLGKEIVDVRWVSFKGCSSLRTFYVDPDNWSLTADNSGCLYDREMKTLYRAPCAITGEYTVLEGTTCIAMDAFEDCKFLHILNIPASVTEIEGVDWRELEGDTLSGCDGLSEINVHPDNPSYRSVSGCLYKGNFLLCTPQNLHGDCQIPEGTTEIGQSAFSGRTALSSVTIPASVTSVGKAAFADCTGMGEIIFLGSAPVFASTESSSDVFSNVTATAYRPLEDQSWTDENMIDYGGKITWIAYEAGERPWEDNGSTEPSEPTEPDVQVNPFGDVPEYAFFYEPVLWAVEKGITNGTTATTFSPDDQCQRSHVVTFLWRAAGCPEPAVTTHPFTDVKETAFYYKAMLWAVENGITNGLDTTHFGPDAYCSRAQVVTFLYRAMEEPEVTTTECPFTDVKAGKWYETPVLWAVENNVTNGMGGGIFGVDTVCNRSQVVTFLYRAFVTE